MNVGELKQKLDDFGDHVPVQLVIERMDTTRTYKDFQVEDSSREGEVTVELTVYL